MELLFLVFILGTYFGYKITLPGMDRCLRHRVRALGLPVFADPGGGNEVPSDLGWTVVGRRRTLA
jgi:hypothetical protein